MTLYTVLLILGFALFALVLVADLVFPTKGNEAIAQHEYDRRIEAHRRRHDAR